MPPGYPRWQRKLWWKTSPRGQLITLCRENAIPIVQNLHLKDVCCIIGNVEVCAIDDFTVLVKKRGDVIKEITGTRFRIYLYDERTLAIEADGKIYNIRFRQPIVRVYQIKAQRSHK